MQYSEVLRYKEFQLGKVNYNLLFIKPVWANLSQIASGKNFIHLNRTSLSVELYPVQVLPSYA